MSSPAGSTFLHNIIFRPLFVNYEIISKIGLSQSMHIYLKNDPAKFHPDPI